MDSDTAIRAELINYLENQHTHRSLQDAAADFPEELMNVKPEVVPYTFWQMLEHIRITQYDMLDFIRNKDYKELQWPKDYWPDPGQKATKMMWDESVSKYEKDIDDLKKILKDEKNIITERIPLGTGQTILREVLQIIDHASYHIGQFILMRRLVDNWKK